jgi:hypothetical protein
MKVAIVSLIAAGAFIAAAPAWAHHSFAATYDEGKSVTVEGKVSEYLYRNPHTLFSVETTDDQGKVTKWEAEWFGAGRLGRGGVTQETFQPGDHVILTGAPGRYTDDHRLHLKVIVRPSDGLRYDNKSLGFPGRDPR